MTLALHNPEAEINVLGALLLDRTSLALVRPLLPAPAAFAGKQLDVVYAAILRICDRGDPVEPVSLRTELLNIGLADCGALLAEIVDATPSAANAEFHARIVLDCWRRRTALDEAGNLIKKLHEPTIALDAALSETIGALSLTTGSAARRSTTVKDSFFQWMDRFDDVLKGGKLPGVSTGLRQLDEMIDGLMPGRLIILAAAPKEGKTALALSMIRAALDDADHWAMLASREMGHQEITERLVSSVVGLNVSKFRRQRATDAEVARISMSMGHVGAIKLLIDEDAGTPAMIQLAAQSLQSRNKLGLLVVDYLQLLRPDRAGQNRNLEIGEMTAALKHLARQLNVPVLALSQLNRESRKANRPPEMHDLRDSGNIEQDADQVIMLHTTDDPGSRGERGPRAVDLYVRGNRHGETGKIPLLFKSWIGRFQEAEALQAVA